MAMCVLKHFEIRQMSKLIFVVPVFLNEAIIRVLNLSQGRFIIGASFCFAAIGGMRWHIVVNKNAIG